MAFALPMLIDVPEVCSKGGNSCYFYDETEPFGDAYCNLQPGTFLPKPGEEKPCGLNKIAIAGS